MLAVSPGVSPSRFSQSARGPFRNSCLGPLPPQTAMTSPCSLSHPGASLEVSPRTDSDCDLHIAWEAAEKLMSGSHQKGFADMGPTGPCREAGVLYCCPAHLDSTLLFAKHCWRWTGQVLLVAIFYQYTEVQRGSVTCSRSHSWEAVNTVLFLLSN